MEKKGEQRTIEKLRFDYSALTVTSSILFPLSESLSSLQLNPLVHLDILLVIPFLLLKRVVLDLLSWSLRLRELRDRRVEGVLTIDYGCFLSE